MEPDTRDDRHAAYIQFLYFAACPSPLLCQSMDLTSKPLWALIGVG
jgi:hypothetical protein